MPQRHVVVSYLPDPVIDPDAEVIHFNLILCHADIPPCQDTFDGYRGRKDPVHTSGMLFIFFSGRIREFTIP